jgi:hypothetical protein
MNGMRLRGLLFDTTRKQGDRFAGQMRCAGFGPIPAGRSRQASMSRCEGRHATRHTSVGTPAAALGLMLWFRRNVLFGS